MRTVTFSNPKLSAEINEKFVPVWINRAESAFHNCEKHTEKRIFDTSQEAYATRNICTFFMTPGLDVVHYVAGYYAPDLFKEAMDVALSAMEAAEDAEAFARRHQAFADLCGQELKAIEAASKPVRGSLQQGWEKIMSKYKTYKYEGNHQHGPECLHHLKEAITYWKTLHETFAAAGAPPKFDEVRRNYKFGNGFSEEPHPERTETPKERPGKKPVQTKAGKKTEPETGLE